MSAVRLVGINDMRRQLAAYEAKHGVPSDRLEEAFTVDGVLHETDDFLDWCHVATIVKKYGKP